MRKVSRKNRVTTLVELLERRQLLSAAALPVVTEVAITGGTELHVQVTGGQSVTIFQNGDTVTVNECGQLQTFTGPFAEIVGQAVSGNNRITLGAGITEPSMLIGGSGNDTLAGGCASNDTLYAGTGNDQLVAGGGNATIVATTAGNDTLLGGSGHDSFWATNSDTIKNVNSANTAAGAVHTLSGPVTSAAGTNLTAVTDPSIGLSGTSYKSFSSDPLFGASGPSANDIIQGQLGDCYFLATLSALAQTDSNSIRQDITQLSDGSYLVRFENGSTPDYVHVNGDLPVNGGGNLVYADLGGGNSTWVAVLEKAFAVFRNSANSYANIASGWMSEVYTDLGVNCTNGFFLPTAASEMTTIQSDLAAGDAVTVGILTPSAGTPLIGDHAYSVVAVTTDGNGNVTGLELRNPWGIVGVSGYAGNGGYVTVTAAQAFAAIEGFTAGAC